ncbi:MCP four helix bundle domain-containing protein [Emticicia sp. 21SJ11W-3]|uniref:MCP four helix bundle domain-containing protein n=1 Tax=Emticicia sp. 21SJ11W-3 TaxID=2916755 RepID=UPI0020A1007D|nr:MCP four helix bundle domain-containing protein [Emticicia sp. 21SJ11W-3]UTA69088.1 MCP four helix bundle domain-containing protein [Emticicia sp. 21SJ11W-3]
MKWAYSIEQKVKAAMGLTVIFVFLFIKNVSDKHHFNELGDSFSAVYEDRLMAESYIYELSNHLSRKKLLVDDCNTKEEIAQIKDKIKQHNQSINALIVSYEKTKLTATEEVLFKDFKKKIAHGLSLEQKHIYRAGVYNSENVKYILDEAFYGALNTLNHLSNIQITEGEKLNKTSQRIVLGSASDTQFELTLLIVLGTIILTLIFSSRSTMPKTPQNPSLN